MKTYLVITPFFPSDFSHVGSYVFDQLEEIRKQTDFNIEIIKVVSFFSIEKDYYFKGFRVSVFKLIDIPFFVFPGIFNWLNKIRFKLLVQRKKIKEISFSHSHVPYPSSYLVENLNCKKMVQHHGLDVLQLLNGRNDLIRKIQKKYLIKNTIFHLNQVDLNICVSNRVLNNLNKFKDYNSKSDCILYNGVDLEKFFPIQTKKNKIFSIGCIANFWPIKDHLTLIKSIKLLVEEGITDIKLRLIGTGEMLDVCIQFVKFHNLSDYIVFESERTHNQLNQFYNEIDLFVLPSFYEASACVLMEAWATETPFISIENQGVAELVPFEERKNLIAKQKSPESLKIKIKGEYDMRRKYPFNNKYNIKNTISEFLKHSIFND